MTAGCSSTARDYAEGNGLFDVVSHPWLEHLLPAGLLSNPDRVRRFLRNAFDAPYGWV
jgi:hypothetical protein